MRIALITDGIWPYVIGGMQKHSFYLCKYLAQKKVHIDLVHFNASEFNIHNLEFFTDEEKKYIRSILIPFPKTVPFPGHYMYASYKYSKLIYKELKDQLNSYNFIYTKGFTGWYLIHQKKKNKGITVPIGVKFHGYEMFQKSPSLKIKLQHVLLLRMPVRDLNKNADVVFSYGGKITNIIQNMGVQPEHIVELPSGVESNTLVSSVKPTGSVIKFLFLGRYERRKGIEELNKAILLVNKEQPNTPLEFHFVGPLPESVKLSSSNAIYHGEIRDRNKLIDVVRSCDVLICPSWSEGMPNVILEAMAAGLTVIATDVGATNVLVNPQTGYLLDAPEPERIKKTLITICNSSLNELDHKKHAALTHVRENFVWERLIEKLYNFFLSK